MSISYALSPIKALDQTQPKLKQERVCALLDNIPHLPKNATLPVISQINKAQNSPRSSVSSWGLSLLYVLD